MPLRALTSSAPEVWHFSSATLFGQMCSPTSDIANCCFASARDFLSLGTVQSLFRQMVTWFGLDHEWLGPGGRIFQAVCGTLGGAMLLWERPYLVPRALL